MKITQLRNATVLLEFESCGNNIRLLVDPMLAPRGALPTLKYLRTQRRRNPLVGMPPQTPELLQRVTHGLITHCQRGHFDHLDRAGKRFLRESAVPVICMPRDARYLTARGIKTQPLHGEQTQPFFHGHITPIPCVHGHGLVGHLMEHGYGYFIDLPGEPTVYIAGDTLFTDAVRLCLTGRRPDVAILPGGGAQFDFGAKILMDATDILDACALTSGSIVVNHLEALDHCPVSRAELATAAARTGLMDRLHIPEDGAVLEFHRPPRKQ